MKQWPKKRQFLKNFHYLNFCKIIVIKYLQGMDEWHSKHLQDPFVNVGLCLAQSKIMECLQESSLIYMVLEKRLKQMCLNYRLKKNKYNSLKLLKKISTV